MKTYVYNAHSDNQNKQLCWWLRVLEQWAAIRRCPMSKVRETPGDGGRWSGCEQMPHVRGWRGSPGKMVGGEHLRLESSPVPTRDAQSTHANLVRPGPRRPTETETGCVWGSPRGCGSAGSAAGTGSGCGHGTSPGTRSPLTRHGAAGLPRACETGSGRHKGPWAPGPRRKDRDPTGDGPGLARECPGVSGGGVGRWGPAAG